MAARNFAAVSAIPQLQARGMTATQALNHLRDQGLGIRTQTFYRAWGEAQAAAASRVAVEAARLDRRPAPNEVTPMRTVSATGYRYQFDALISRGVTNEVYRTPIAAKFDKLVSYDTALQAILGTLVDAQVEEGSLQGDRILGAIPTEVRELVPSDFSDES